MRKISSIILFVYALLMFFLIMLIVLPFILLGATFLKDKIATNFIFFFLRLWGSTLLLVTGYKVEIIGHEKIKNTSPVIFVSNHNSYLDSPAVVVSTPHAVKPLGKIEMVKVPIFGLIYKKYVVLIDRSSPESRAKSVAEMKIQLSKGISMLIFPEGKMNKGKLPLNEFYDGAFRIGIEMQTPIVPMVIINARNLLSRNDPFGIKTGKITCIFSEPIETKDYSISQIVELKEKVFKVMETLILENETLN